MAKRNETPAPPPGPVVEAVGIVTLKDGCYGVRMSIPLDLDAPGVRLIGQQYEGGKVRTEPRHRIAKKIRMEAEKLCRPAYKRGQVMP